MSAVYQETFRIRSYETDFNGNVKISSIFNYMQEAASVHAGILDFGYERMTKEGLFWVLSRAKIVMSEYLTTFEDIIVETWPKNIFRLFANRDFRFYNSGNNCIGSATTAWLMVSGESLRPVNPESLLLSRHLTNIPPGIDENLDKIPEPSEKTFISDYKLGYKDIDLNNHTNNARYIEYLLDCFDDKFNSGSKISSIQVNFLNQTKADDKIRLFMGSDKKEVECTYLEAINQDDNKVFNSRTCWL
jgi:acyl-ACP thioesterase